MEKASGGSSLAPPKNRPMLVRDAAGLFGPHKVQGEALQIGRFIVRLRRIVSISRVPFPFIIDPMPKALTIVVKRSIDFVLPLMTSRG